MPVHHRDQRRGAGGGSTYKVLQTIVTDSTSVSQAQRIIGSGAFGVVYEAKVQETGETVAIKKV